MGKIRISAVGQPRQEVDLVGGETLSQVLDRLDIDVPTGAGVEIWVNGTKCENPRSYVLKDGDSVVLMPNLKGQ